ncbi:hypothetical protein [Paenibacillus radicis (ex Xue et al. 2023)]|uniref:DUF4139 domain-containing protein n=1 Tax=Paenibacillus radicis (ex Xue et al. 2023) TaxID=2972489 RepID=A0ABT1YNY8_9BACL|nr:hypothetical protein [Paenibacillus radicis (ex Xue et al. 2023)]MCR8634897.1 hypothetical protein [Paenibacillus radicis (ex Xue et al. 2023)]
MKINWKKTVASVVISTSLMTSSYAAIAAEPVDSAAEALGSTTYQLNDIMSVEIKSVLNEHVLGGTRIGVIVRMRNNGSSISRVPEYEVRVKTNEGVEYILQASASNPKSIQPKANTELSYLSDIDRTDTVTLSEVNWTDVDYYVYPKKETLMVAVPINGQAWKGSDMPITNPAAVKKWGEPFAVPSLLSPLQYQPVSIEKEVTDKGTVQVVQFLVTNPAQQREKLPEFVIDGKSETQSFSGKKIEQDEIILEANEKKYIHYAVPTDNDTVLSSINVLTPEQFSQSSGGQGGQPVTVKYNVGRLSILLPNVSAPASYSSYQMGETMKFDTLSELIHPNLNVSVVEMHMNDNEDEGSKSVTAKFKLFNKSDQPIAVPVFQTDLVSSDGFTYTGNRQNIATQRILPNSGLVINYAYTLPASEKGTGLVIRVNDTQKAAPYKTTIAAYGINLQQMDGNDKFSVYPFDAKINYWTVSPLYNRKGDMTYSYKARFDLELKRAEQIQVDASFSKLQLEIYNTTNNLIGTKQISFIGANRLITGENNIMLDATSEQLERPLTIKLYEWFSTPAGDSKRLLGVFTQ